MAILNGWINEVLDVSSVSIELMSLENECGVKYYFTGMNGGNCIFFYYDRNHYGLCFEKIIDLFTIIARNADSYGMLYIQDDESKEFHDEFQVYIARKGIVTKVNDVYFSPCSEMIWNYDDD